MKLHLKQTNETLINVDLWLGLTPSDVWMRIIKSDNVVQLVGNPWAGAESNVENDLIETSPETAVVSSIIVTT